MFSTCANPDCRLPFIYGQGKYFRFHKHQGFGEPLPNTHSVQHLWLCNCCCQQFTLEYSETDGVLLRNRQDLSFEAEVWRCVAVA